MKNKYFYYTLSPLVFFGLWELSTRMGWFDARFFPAPTTIVHYLIFTSPEEGIIRDILASLQRIAGGYLLGSLSGVIVGIAMGLSPIINASLYPMVAMLYPLPKIAILPLIMLVFGIGELSKIVVVAIGSFFLVLMSTLHGVKTLSPVYLDIASVYRISKLNTVLHIVIPGSLPAIFTGLRLAIGYSLVIVVAAEFSGANEGIGYLIWQSWETFSIKAMYAGIFVIGILGLLFAFIIEALQRHFIPWQK